MKSNRIAKLLFIVSLLVIVSAFFLNAQTTKTGEETEVPILKKTGSTDYGCFPSENAVISKATFEKIIGNKNCSYPAQTLNVDFENETLINYHVRGDCFVYAGAKVFRSDKEKKYTVRVKKASGGCRAAGEFHGWLVIEKVPSDYKVEFSETIPEYAKWLEKDVLFRIKKPLPETLETRPIELKGCIHTYRQQQFVIKDNESYLKAMRNDASRDFCLKEVEKIDFAKHTLLGIEIDSGYCRYPLGLRYQTVKDAEKKQYTLNISYIEPRGTCRALSQYDLWVLVPKLPDGYEVKFEVKAESSEAYYKIPLSKINLAEIGRIAPKGRVQDKDYNRLPVVEQLLAHGKESIPFLIGKLEDETKISGRVMDYWSQVYVGDVALIILIDFFLDRDWRASTIRGVQWDEFLMRGSNRKITAEQLLRDYIKKFGRRKIKERWQEIWNKHQEKIYWDESERAFKLAK